VYNTRAATEEPEDRLRKYHSRAVDPKSARPETYRESFPRGHDVLEAELAGVMEDDWTVLFDVLVTSQA